MRFLLLQSRDDHDPMRHQEIECFASALNCNAQQIKTLSLLGHTAQRTVVNQYDIDSADVVLFGGSGDYSVAQGGVWMPSVLALMRSLVEQSKPTFASCWGFQAMAKALGGEVVTDMSRAEIGTLPVQLTAAGLADPVMGTILEPGQASFDAVMGHMDVVTRLPDGAIHLAFTDKVAHQAFRVRNKPIYCTQFHPELDRAALIQRLEAYPAYVTSIAGMPLEEFESCCKPTPSANLILQSFVGALPV